MCCVEYTPCADASSYSLQGVPDAVNMQDSQCTKDYVGIEGINWARLFLIRAGENV